MCEKLKINFITLIALGLGVLFFTHAHAEIEVLPTSHHQQYLSYGLFNDEQSSLVFRSEGKSWLAVGGFISLAELKDWAYTPQLVIHGLATSGLRINTRGDTLLTDTVDAHVGLSFDLKFSNSTRGSISWTHQSGHISDNIPETDLIGSNLGNEFISFRFVHDLERRFRIGGSLRPFLGTEPKMKAFGANQFLEWFFNGASENPHQFSPFTAIGLEQYGLNQVECSFHAQIGFAAGNHFGEERTSSLRTVLGYYNGMDPRLKYYQFKNKKTGFLYGGLMFDL